MPVGLHAAREKLERYGKDLLYGSSLFFPLRTGYRFLFKRDARILRRKMCEFYAPFIRPGDLVFDVGANVGVYAETFTELGATVVAIEPNPRCCDKLRQLAKTRPVRVENCAVGSICGSAIIHICAEHQLSTVSNEMLKTAHDSPLHSHVKWLEDLEVEILTLDRISAKYGHPSFVKIDVEGFEDEVLEGTTFSPAALSFEYKVDLPQVALGCLDLPVLAQGYDFNYVRGLELEYASDNWMSADVLRTELPALAGNVEYGDILARRVKSV
jgi:FkbM family methyltransferase